MMTLRQTSLLSATFTALDHALNLGTQNDKNAALIIAREMLTIAAELEQVERAKVAPAPGDITDLDENCG